PTPAFSPHRAALLPDVHERRCFAAVRFLLQAGVNPRCLLLPAWPFEVLRPRVPAQHQAPRLGPRGNGFYFGFQLAAVEAAPFVLPSRPISLQLWDRPQFDSWPFRTCWP